MTSSGTIVIPTHNEILGLRRLLPRLLSAAEAGEFTVIVVCNGCTDGSADEARRFGPDIEVIELGEPSKAAALAAGGAKIRNFPVAFIDADVSLDTASLRRLIALVSSGELLAAAPERRLERHGVSLVAGWYYDIWERLPPVRTGLFGRGVIVLSEAGYRRVSSLPQFISDDLAFSESFLRGERGIDSGAVVSVWPARTWTSLVKRRMRVVQGSRELSNAGGISASGTTHPGDLVAIVRQEPLMAARLPVFLIVTVLARLGARFRRGNTAWLRDETSRER